MDNLEAVIEEKIGEVRTDSLDFSFGELISLKAEGEFELTPDYQRLFRWSQAQRSRLIESILLELPIPQIFVVEQQNGVYELVDGLQRISSVIQFVEPNLIELDPLKLDGCDLIKVLNDKTFSDLPLSLRLRIKRSKVRAVIIKRTSSSMLRYEMFKRLNTGGSDLSEQEIRNCTARMIGENGIKFYGFLGKCANLESFQTCISTLPDSEKDKRGDEELVLRYLALKRIREHFKGSVRDWLDVCMEEMIFERISFDYKQETNDFVKLFDYLEQILNEGAFVRYRNNKPIGGLAPAYFEAVTLGVWNKLSELTNISHEDVREKLIDTLQSEKFRSYVGSGSNARPKFNGRINTIEEALEELIAHVSTSSSLGDALRTL